MRTPRPLLLHRIRYRDVPPPGPRGLGPGPPVWAWFAILAGTLVLVGWREVRTSELQSRLLPAVARGLSFAVVPGPSPRIVWPEGVTPFHVGIVNLRQGDAAADAACASLYAALTAAGLEPLYDDRDERAGAKFATMDLIGLPLQLVVGPKGLEKGVVELKRRATGEREELSLESAMARLAE